MKTKWTCPECGAPPNKHGKGGDEKCLQRAGCQGFLCECDDNYDSKEHGTEADPCHEANCYHCGWGGTFPIPKFDPKKLKGAFKVAWAAGWRPPVGWTPSARKVLDGDK